jgi:hypothetical protein
MAVRKLIVALALPLLTGCAFMQNHSGTVAGFVGARATLDVMDMWSKEYIYAGLVAYALVDPLAPNWQIQASGAGDDRVRLDMWMKRLASGGEGEARQIFMRNARQLAADGGYAGFDVLWYEEGIDSIRPWARRVAQGEIRLVGSRQFPGLPPQTELSAVAAEVTETAEAAE